MRRILLALPLFAALVFAASPAAAKRVALVIGIGTYKSLAGLANPVPDAKAVATVLKANGFDVFEYYDLDRADLLDALEAFKDEADGADVAFAYYAGHGMEVGGRNVIAPADLEISCEPRQAKRAVELDRLFEALGRAPQQVVLLDACRNDPFPQCAGRSAGGDGSGFRGFSRITGDNQSLLIANATLPGQLAADGVPGAHSPFAKALLARFDANPKMFLRDLLDATARDVQLASGGSQVPEVTTRGGAPAICLAGDGCTGSGGGDGAAPVQAMGAAEIAEARALLARLGYGLPARGGEDAALVGAIRKFQAGVGLPMDGAVSPTLLAVLRASVQVAALPPDDGPAPAPPPPMPSASAEHAPGSTFRDCENCPEMVALAPGAFMMGSGEDPDGTASEKPQHVVSIGKPFAVSKLEITFDEWEVCTLEGGCGGYRPKDSGWGRGARPVIYVSWDDAKAYVEWLRQASGKPYRLLTEAEWEYAARAGTTTPFATGATITTAEADFDDSASGQNRGDYEGRTVDVGSYPPNPYGLHDMAGNVWEWVEDCWNKTHAGAPADGSARGGDCARRVIKGGAWYFERAYLRSAARLSYPKGSRLNVIGFRVARDLE